MYKLVVLFCAVSMAAAKPSVGVVPLTYGAAVVPAVSSVSQYSSGVLHGSPLVYSSLYAPGVLAQAPHSPAVVLDAWNGVPLDTPEVVAARAAHFQAKALSGLHHLKKRSVAVAPVAYGAVSPVAYSAYTTPVVSAYSSPLFSAYSSPLVSTYGAYASPLAYHGVVPKALSVHPW